MGPNDREPHTRSTDPKVRSACDRCRSQKLKCDQSLPPNGTGKCSRCVKSNTECSTSAPRPSGRPSRQQQRKQNKAQKPSQIWDTENEAVQYDDPTPSSTTVTTRCRQFEDPAMQFDIFGDSMFASFGVEDFSFNPTFSATNKEYPSNSLDGLHQHIVSDMPRPMLELGSRADGVAEVWSRKGLQPPLSINRDKSYHLKTLAELNSSLLQHLSVIDKLVYADCCKADLSEYHGYHPQHQSLHSHHPGSNLGVNTMLGFLQAFTKILTYFLIFSHISTAPRLTSSLDAANEDETNSNDSDIDFEERPNVRYDANDCWDDSDNDGPFNSENTTRNTRAPNTPLMDYPTILALTTCYVSLIRLHRMAFNRILSSLETASQHDAVPTSKDLPPLIPDLNMAGYSLGMHRSIQISVFMHVVLDLLWRAEKGIIAVAAAVRNGAATSTSGHMELLRTMLKQEAATAGHSTHIKDKAVGRYSLKLLASRIRALCRGNICLQLEETTVTMESFSAAFDSGMGFGV